MLPLISLNFHLFEIAFILSPFVYCQSFYSVSLFLVVSAYILGQNALQCSQVGRLLPSPRALCLCVLAALLCCQTRRLVIQSGWRGVALQIRPPLKELLLHAAPYVGSDWLPAYRRRTFASLPTFFPHFSSLSLCTLLPKPALSLSSSLWLSELRACFPPHSDCFSFCSHPAISNKCTVKPCFYLALGVGDMNECSLYLLPVQ